MSEPDEDIRRAFLAWFDSFIEDPDKSESMIKKILENAEIHRDVETVLAFIVGVSYGCAYFSSKSIYGDARKQDLEGISNLIYERTWILREAFLRTRIEEP